MTDYNKFVLAVNKIFEVINNIKAKNANMDNLSYIESIEEYKQIVVSASTKFSNQKDPRTSMTSQKVMEKLSNLEDE